jgi:hypothetical protein
MDASEGKKVGLMRGINIIVIVSMVILMASSASAISINLRSPADGVSISEFTVAFIYGFSEVPSMNNCSLVIDGAIKTTRSALINYDNNKITQDLPEGTYKWMISCSDTTGKVITSEERTINVNVQMDTKDGYQTIYKNNKLRVYVISISQSHPALSLPGMLGGEEFDIKTKKTTYFFDLVRMGSDNGTYFSDIRVRPLGKNYRLVAGVPMDFNLEETDAPEVRVTLEKVERGVLAFFKVEAYPTGNAPVEPAVNETEELPPVPVTINPTVPATTEQSSPNVTQPAISPPTKDTTPENKQVSGSYTWLTVLIVIVLLGVIVAVIYNASRKAASPSKKKELKKEEKEEPRKDESFDVIKSTSAKKGK